MTATVHPSPIRGANEIAFETVPLASITWSPTDNPRSGLYDDQRIAELCRSDVTAWAPIVVSPIPNKLRQYRGVDGFARCEAARKLGLKHLRARIIAPPEDVRIESFRLNSVHGFHLSIAERCSHVWYLHCQDRLLSFKALGRLAGVSDKTAAAAVRSRQAAKRARANRPPLPLRDLPSTHPRVILAFLERIVGDRAEWTSINDAARGVKALVHRDALDDFLQDLGESLEAALDLAIELGYNPE